MFESLTDLPWLELCKSTVQTLYMVGVSGLIAVLFGLPLGVLIVVTQQDHILPSLVFNRILIALIDGLRSVPFIILLVALIPITRFLVGTSIGTAAAIVPLSIGAIPFVARIVESALLEVPGGLIEAGKTMGATPLQIITRILIPEALPGIIKGITVTLVALVGYSAMAGTVGGGGLGDLAIRYGYHRFELNVMLATIVILIVLVQLLQYTGDRVAAYFNHR